MADFTDLGLTIETQSEILEQMQDSVRTGVPGGQSLNTGSTSIVGEFLGITSSHLSEIQDALLALWLSLDVNSATGAALERLVALNGVTRLGALPSVVDMELDLAAGTYGPGVLTVHHVDDPAIRFSNRDNLVLGAPDASYTAVFESEEDGPINAGAGKLTQITTPVVGFNAATNPLDATPGRLQETDASLRTRRASLLALRGASSVDAIRAEVAQVTGVTYVRVMENDTDVTSDGIPPHSFETMVLGGDNVEIADAIFGSKPAGIRAFGSTNVSVADSQTNAHNIGFTRPTDVNVYITVTLTYVSGLYVGDSDLKSALNDWGDANLGPGNDVIHARVVEQVMKLPGVVDATVFLGTAPSPVSENNVVINVRQIARVDVSRIVVNATSVTGAP